MAIVKMILATTLPERTDKGLCGVIGVDGKLPWNLKGDLKRFKKLTTGCTVIMGNGTYKSLGSVPLPDRDNLIISNKEKGKNYVTLDYVKEYLIRSLEADTNETIWIIGGESIFDSLINFVSEIELTVLCIPKISLNIKKDSVVSYGPIISDKVWNTDEPKAMRIDPDTGMVYYYHKLIRK